jgi:MFS family permease
MFSSSLLASALVSPIMTPLFGNLIDRFGIRRVTLPTTALYGLALCSFSLLNAGAFWAIFVMVACASGFGACLGPLVFSKSITSWFDKERGLTLGIATCGVGLGTLALPALAEFFIKSSGWRTAHVAVGATAFVRLRDDRVVRARAAGLCPAHASGARPSGRRASAVRRFDQDRDQRDAPILVAARHLCD